MSIKTILIKNTGYNLGGYFYLLLASFFSVSVLLNNLGRDVFGVYVFLISFISLSAVFDFGLSSAVVRKLSLPEASKDEKVKTWQTSFVIFITLAAILSVFVYVLLSYLSSVMPIFVHLDKNTASVSAIVLSFIVFVNHINIHFLNLPQAEQRFDVFNIKTILVGTANTIISAIISGYFPNIALLFFVQLCFHLLTSIFMINY